MAAVDCGDKNLVLIGGVVCCGNAGSLTGRALVGVP
jgi:hypothetical protein